MKKRVLLMLASYVGIVFLAFLLSKFIDLVEANRIPDVLQDKSVPSPYPACDQGFPSKPDYKITPYTCEGN